MRCAAVNAPKLDRRLRHGHPIEAEIATNGQLTEIDLALQHRPAAMRTGEDTVALLGRLAVLAAKRQLAHELALLPQHVGDVEVA
jgi:hypothetical protein